MVDVVLAVNMGQPHLMNGSNACFLYTSTSTSTSYRKGANDTVLFDNNKNKSYQLYFDIPIIHKQGSDINYTALCEPCVCVYVLLACLQVEVRRPTVEVSRIHVCMHNPVRLGFILKEVEAWEAWE